MSILSLNLFLTAPGGTVSTLHILPAAVSRLRRYLDPSQRDGYGLGVRKSLLDRRALQLDHGRRCQIIECLQPHHCHRPASAARNCRVSAARVRDINKSHAM